jgi:hypothetical protein
MWSKLKKRVVSSIVVISATAALSILKAVGYRIFAVLGESIHILLKCTDHELALTPPESFWKKFFSAPTQVMSRASNFATDEVLVKTRSSAF